MRFGRKNMSSCLACCTLLLLPVATAALRVGAFCDTSSEVGKKQKLALEIAARDFNSSNRMIFLNIHSNTSHYYQATSKAKDLIRSWGAEALIVATTWLDVASIANAASQLKVPVVSLSPEHQPASLNNPFFVQMSYPRFLQVQCIANLVRSYNWARLVVIYEDDSYSSISTAMVAQLSHELQALASEIDHHIVFPAIDKINHPTVVVRQHLETLMSRLCNVYVVLHSSPTLAIHLFTEAKRIGLMEKGHVWIVDDDVAGHLDDDSFFPAYFISSFMQGVVGIKAYFNEANTLYSKFHKEFRRKYPTYAADILTLRAYDAVHAIASAATVIATKDKKNMTSFLGGLLSNDFQGLSGRIQFRGLELRNDSVIFQVINIVGKSYRELGLWVNGQGFYKSESVIGHDTPKMSLNGLVYWPGGPERTPGGWGKLRIIVPRYTMFRKFVFMVKDGNGTSTVIDGFCIDVFKESLKVLKYDLDYEFHPFIGSYDELVNQVALKHYDVAVGDITILSYRAKNVTFTMPFISSALVKMIRVRPIPATWIFTRPFTGTVWIMIGAALIYSGFVVWLFERNSNNPDFGGPWYNQLGATLSFIFMSFFYRHGEVRSYYSKIIMVAWLFFVMFTVAVYTANLAAILAVGRLHQVDNDTKIGCEGSFAENYLKNVVGYTDDMIVSLPSEDSVIPAFESGNITAAYLESPYLRILLSQHRGYSAYGRSYRLGGFGMAFQKGSPLASDFSEAILKLEEDGTLNKLEEKWFSFTLSTSPSSTSPSDSTHEDSLDANNYIWLFTLTCGTTTIVLLIFTTHLLIYSRFVRGTCSWFLCCCRSIWNKALENIRKALALALFESIDPTRICTYKVRGMTDESNISF